MKFLSKNIKINIVLVIGLTLIFTGILLLTSYFASNPQSVYLFRGVVLFLFGATILFIELMKSTKTWLMFISLVFMLISVVLVIVDVGFIPLKITDIWPIFVIIFGLSLILFSFYKTKHLKAVYFIPALTIIIFGTFFMLFSMNIIKISFVSLASKLWPLLLVLCGGVLITIYFIQRHNLLYFAQNKSEEDDE